MTDTKTARQMSDELRSLSLSQRIAYIARIFPDLKLTTSFSTEDQLLTWAVVDSGVNMPVTTHLDGYLLENTQTLREITQERYDIDIPDGAKNGGKVWISGRSQQKLNADRNVDLAVWHEENNMLEINPLADWSFEEVLQKVAAHEVPINPLTFTPPKTRIEITSPQSQKQYSQGAQTVS